MAVTLAATANERLSLGYNGTGTGLCGYNGQPYNGTLNPGGMDGNGVAVNWIHMCADLVELGIITAAQATLAAAAADRQQAWGPVWAANMGTVTYVNATRCTVDTTGTNLTVGTHVQADCGADGYKFGVVSGASESGGVTTVDFSWFGGGALTSNLKSITTIDESRMVYVVDLETPVAAAAGSAATALASKTAAAASQVAAASSQVAAAASAALAASYVAGTDPDQLVRAGDLGTAAWVDQTWLYAATTWNAPSVASGAQTSTTVAVPGADVGDYALVSCGTALSGLGLRGEVTAQDVVTLYLSNVTGTAVDLASATYYVAVLKRIAAR
ncbi:hypothetical protein [Solidesulfovibrio alcoholivorans]|uniref:hypothetical protein n=1 Tax=Solidesulfovibrio alcoholivorans TaxID=81406 RepID=UPI000496C338|nr:hypothetical protein [Solidesulfovibrio alcoholivorans]